MLLEQFYTPPPFSDLCSECGVTFGSFLTFLSPVPMAFCGRSDDTLLP